MQKKDKSQHIETDEMQTANMSTDRSLLNEMFSKRKP